MVDFDLWKESFIFALVYGGIIIIPCVLVALIGKKMIDRLGKHPSRTPVIQMSIFLPLVAIEIATFACLIGFYKIFSGK